MLVIAQPYDENRCNRDADDYAIQQHMHVSSFPLTMGTYEEAKTMHVYNRTLDNSIQHITLEQHRCKPQRSHPEWRDLAQYHLP
jgi:hypothetical protein